VIEHADIKTSDQNSLVKNDPASVLITLIVVSDLCKE
jgi:hypothetical protein